MITHESVEEQSTSGNTSSINISQKERRLSTIGGVALMLFALRLPKRFAALAGTIGANLLYQGTTGQSLVHKLLGKNTAVHNKDAAISVPHEQGIRVVHSITINRPADEIYTFWRDFSNLPHFMQNLKAVTVKSPTQSRWSVKGPAGTTLEWDAEVVNAEPNTVIGWRSLENPYVDHAGSVRFRPAPRKRGTEVTVEMEYAPIGGKLGAAIAALLGESPERQIQDDLQRLKQHLEAGEIATVEGQSSGRK